MTAFDEQTVVSEVMDDVRRRAFGLNLKQLREKAELTRAELADLIDSNVRIIESWEQGRRVPQTLDLPVLATALGVTVEQLFALPAGEEPPNPKRGRPKKRLPTNSRIPLALFPSRR